MSGSLTAAAGRLYRRRCSRHLCQNTYEKIFRFAKLTNHFFGGELATFAKTGVWNSDRCLGFVEDALASPKML
jgi:hypothetical protein